MGRICAMVGCSNSVNKLDVWLSQLCEVHGLKFGSCVCKPPFTLFPFPSETKDPERRKKWVRIVNRKTKGGKNWTPSDQARICSAHFKEGEPTKAFPDPTEKLGYDPNLPSTSSRGKLPRKPPKEKVPYELVGDIRREQRKRKRKEQEEVGDLAVADDRPTSEEPPCKSESTCLADRDYLVRCTCSENCSCSGCIDKQKEINRLDFELTEEKWKSRMAKNKQLKTTVSKLGICKVVLKNDKTVRAYTGIETMPKFESLLNMLAPKVNQMAYWSGKKKAALQRTPPKGNTTPKKKKPGPARALSVREEFVLVLLKLRMALTISFLAGLFSVSSSTASQIFNTWIKFLAEQLKPLIFWPDKEVVTKTIPKSLKSKYPSLRCTIDCSEIFIERPRNLEIQALTWSGYKKHHTVKFLVGIAPNGMISFLSKAWGGRVSDVAITHQSKFLDLVDPGDIILADRGFVIKEDLLLRQAKLVIPPPSKGCEQQTPDDVSKTKKVANTRIHVERAIGRLKWFAILKETLPIQLVPLIDDILVVCAALVNLHPPLVSN